MPYATLGKLDIYGIVLLLFCYRNNHWFVMKLFSSTAFEILFNDNFEIQILYYFPKWDINDQKLQKKRKSLAIIPDEKEGYRFWRYCTSECKFSTSNAHVYYYWSYYYNDVYWCAFLWCPHWWKIRNLIIS